MGTFVLEIYRPGLTTQASQAIVRTLVRTIAATDPGAVHYRGCTIALADEVCYLRLESEERRSIDALVERLALPDARVAEVVDLE
jgi:hypothetical protein